MSAERRWSILVVCSGNTCRSPAAEAAIRDRSADAGLEVSVASVGIRAGSGGEPPTQRMIDAARDRGLEITGASRQIRPTDLNGVDLVLVLDDTVRLFVESLVEPGSHRIELLGRYSDTGDDEILDPYGKDVAAYAATLDRIIASVDGLIRRLSG